MTDVANNPKKKDVSIDLDTRARMTFVATADFDETEKSHFLNDENMTNEQIKDYMANVLEEIKKKGKVNEHIK